MIFTESGKEGGVGREGRGQGGGVGEKHQCKRDTLIGCLPHEPRPRLGIEPAAQVCALDRGLSSRPFGLRANALTTENTGQGLALLLACCVTLDKLQPVSEHPSPHLHSE